MKYNDQTRWYLIANKSHAAIYEETEKHKFVPIVHLFDEDARKHEGDFDTDVPGSYHSNADFRNRSGMDHHFNSRQQEAVRFTKRIIAQLEQARTQHQFQELVIVAEPKFLGLLKTEFPKGLSERVVDELAREYITQSEQDLRKLVLGGLRSQRERKEKSYDTRPSI